MRPRRNSYVNATETYRARSRSRGPSPTPSYTGPAYNPNSRGPSPVPSPSYSKQPHPPHPARSSVDLRADYRAQELYRTSPAPAEASKPKPLSAAESYRARSRSRSFGPVDATAGKLRRGSYGGARSRSGSVDLRAGEEVVFSPPGGVDVGSEQGYMRGNRGAEVYQPPAKGGKGNRSAEVYSPPAHPTGPPGQMSALERAKARNRAQSGGAGMGGNGIPYQ